MMHADTILIWQFFVCEAFISSITSEQLLNGVFCLFVYLFVGLKVSWNHMEKTCY